MNERIEWIEPEEAADERRDQMESAFRHWHLFAWGMALSVPASIAVLLLSPEPTQAVPAALATLVVPFYPLALRWQLRLLHKLNERSKRTCLLQSDDRQFWQHVRSFDITDHPTLPGIRTLTIRRKTDPRIIQHCFRAGQLDEAELSAFIESRIVEQRERRLMRRVRRKL